MNNPADTLAALAPCPFCGGGVDLERTVDGREWWGVVCRNTENLGGSCAVQIVPSASKDAAINRWNRRASLKGEAEPFGWVYQHEETGHMSFCPNDGVNTPELFQRLNSRHVLCGPAYTTPPAPQADQDTDMMAECMIECREGLIATGIIEASVPPMFVAEAVIAKFRSLTRPTPSPAPQGGGEAKCPCGACPVDECPGMCGPANATPPAQQPGEVGEDVIDRMFSAARKYDCFFMFDDETLRRCCKQWLAAALAPKEKGNAD